MRLPTWREVRITGLAALVTFLIGCEGKAGFHFSSKPSDSKPSEDSIEEYTVSGTELAPPDFYNFKQRANDGRAGLEAHIHYGVNDKGPTGGLKSFTIYEDGKPVFEEKINGEEDFAQSIFTAKPETPGIHTYFAKAVSMSGMKSQSKTLTIAFTGRLMDRIPEIFDFRYRAGNITINARDIGENPGIKSIVLYEDGKPIHTFKENLDSHLKFPIFRRHSAGSRHEYFVKITDIANQTSKSRTIAIKYE